MEHAMPTVSFTANLRRHVTTPIIELDAGGTVRTVLDAAFASHPALRAYILDEQGRLRRHVVVFVDGARVRDTTRLGDAVGDDAQVYVMQALTGG
jgi:molybdopterin converting factor small subunit